MAIEIDIADYIVIGVTDPVADWAVADSPLIRLGDHSSQFWQFELNGGVGHWLMDRGHDGAFRVYKDNDLVTVSFEDPKLAMLFKLTWL